MASAFHWVKIKAVCYATEDEELIHEVMEDLIGTDNEECFDIDLSEGLHGNPITVIDANLTHSKEFERLFRNLGNDVLSSLVESIDEKIDEDCVMYLRLDKQKAVKGEYAISHNGDVISITAKIVAHPAKQEIAVNNARKYLTQILQTVQEQTSQ